MIGSTNCEGDQNRNVNPFVIHNFTFHADHNKTRSGKQLNCTQGQDSRSFVCGPPTESYCDKTLAYSSRAETSKHAQTAARDRDARLQMCLDLANRTRYLGIREI